MLSAPLAALKIPRPDVIVATSPQFFCANAGFLTSRLLHCPWVFEVRDLWPESIVAVGAIRNMDHFSQQRIIFFFCLCNVCNGFF